MPCRVLGHGIPENRGPFRSELSVPSGVGGHLVEETDWNLGCFCAVGEGDDLSERRVFRGQLVGNDGTDRRKEAFRRRLARIYGTLGLQNRLLPILGFGEQVEIRTVNDETVQHSDVPSDFLDFAEEIGTAILETSDAMGRFRRIDPLLRVTAERDVSRYVFAHGGRIKMVPEIRHPNYRRFHDFTSENRHSGKCRSRSIQRPSLHR